MTKRLRGESHNDEHSSENSGDFRLDGSWNPSVEVAHRGPLFRWIGSLVVVRRDPYREAPPSQFASAIQASRWRDAFPEAVAGEWDHLTQFGDWPRVTTRTPAEEAVKRAGYGSPEDGHWEGGRWLPGKDERKHDPLIAASDKASGLLAGLNKLTGPGTGATGGACNLGPDGVAVYPVTR